MLLVNPQPHSKNLLGDHFGVSMKKKNKLGDHFGRGMWRRFVTQMK